MIFREFVLKDDVTQDEYVNFRVDVQDRKPAAWAEIDLLPVEILYDILVRSAIKAGWVQDVVEDDGYGEDVKWEWTEEFVAGIPAGKAPLRTWGEVVLRRWLEYKSLDPN